MRSSWLGFALLTTGAFAFAGCGAESASPQGKRVPRGSAEGQSDTPTESSAVSEGATATPAPTTLPSAPRSDENALEDDLPAGGELVSVGTWTAAQAPRSCTEPLANPIDGCDPARDATWDLDCDEDGVPDHIAYGCDPNMTELGPPFVGRYDCAPGDPRWSVWVAEDRDGDGAVSSGEYNCAAAPLPEGHVPLLETAIYDCDDGASDVHPQATDTWNDGVDSDCGNGDAPACDKLRSGAPFPRRGLQRGACAEADLQLVELAQCGGRCSPSVDFYLMVTNTGGSASPAGLVVQWDDGKGDWGQVELDAIEPGQASPAIEVAASQSEDKELVIWFDHPDCTSADHRFVKPLAAVRCLR